MVAKALLLGSQGTVTQGMGQKPCSSSWLVQFQHFLLAHKARASWVNESTGWATSLEMKKELRNIS